MPRLNCSTTPWPSIPTLLRHSMSKASCSCSSICRRIATLWSKAMPCFSKPISSSLKILSSASRWRCAGLRRRSMPALPTSTRKSRLKTRNLPTSIFWSISMPRPTIFRQPWLPSTASQSLRATASKWGCNASTSTMPWATRRAPTSPSSNSARSTPTIFRFASCSAISISKTAMTNRLSRSTAMC